MSSLKPTNETQLSLFDTNISTDSKDLSSPPVAPVAPSKAPRFLTLSASAHAACFLLISALSIPLLKTEAPELIEFELDPVAQVAPLEVGKTSLGIDTPATQGSSSSEVAAALPTELPEKEAVVATLPPVQKNIAKTSPAAPVVKTPVAEPVAASTPAKAEVAATSRPSVAAPVAPVLETPELDGLEEATQSLAATSNTHQIAEGLDSDLEASSNHVPAVIAAEDFKIDSSATELESLQEMNKLQAMESEQIASLQKSAENSAALARVASEQEAQRKLLGTGKGQGNGAGNNGSPEAGAMVAGSPSGVRSLDQLRQMPNNPRPAYDREERRRGDQGVVAFVAYINKAGIPVNFQLLQSSGFKNLDVKTLAALKKWRFYPGQEGWVEMPFRWDLQGGAQEDGGFLRRVGSR